MRFPLKLPSDVMPSFPIPIPSSPLLPLLAAAVLPFFSARADGPADNIPEKVRPIPPPGIALAAEDRAELERGTVSLRAEIDRLKTSLRSKPELLAHLPDVEIFHKAVDWALRYDQFHKLGEIKIARDLLERGHSRARSMQEGKTPWREESGLIVRAYRSEIDGSIQPYGLVIPSGLNPRAHPVRLDFWFHGRGETLSELVFLDQRTKSPGQFAPRDAIVAHLYGRYSCANKFAGEMDLFETLTHLKKEYLIDENRIVVRGFSMGGAACWQFAVHYPGLWCAAAPGAGFSETPDFLRTFQAEELKPTRYQEKLWRWYNATDYAVNLFNCPTVAYSGELDKQKQAADMMVAALAKENLTLTHIIGPGTAHSYHPDAVKTIAQRVDSIAAAGRNPTPEQVRFTTWTLRYNRCLWVTLDGLESHWAQARINAEWNRPENQITAQTSNIRALTFQFESGRAPFDAMRPVKVQLDGQTIQCPSPETDRSWVSHFRKVGNQWTTVPNTQEEGLHKQHGLQGPIDDAFLQSFVMVRPTCTPLNPQIGQWASREMEHAVQHWQKQFRGEAPVVDDTAITENDIASRNLVLWGDPQSNKLLARILDKLPIQWSETNLQLGKHTFDSTSHVPVLIYPNPLNPQRYIVLNSGFTFREYDYLNNARQVPRLPDYAVVDTKQPATSQSPGGLPHAGFFGERWEWLDNDGR